MTNATNHDEPIPYRVHGILEEFECPMCGAIVENGERAYEFMGDVFCSKACCAQALIGRPGEL
jgi:hypothetical protein